MKKIAIALTAVVVMANSMVHAQTKNPATTSKDQITFTNELFDFRVQKPQAWHALNTEELLALQQQGATLMAGTNSEMKEVMEKALETSLPLFSFLSRPMGTPGKPIISVVSGAENIKQVPSSFTACDYLGHIKSLMAKAAVKYNISENCQILDTGKAKLAYVDASAEINGVKLQQRFMACRKNTYMVTVVQSFGDDEGRKQTSDIVNTFEIRCD
jgi:hypothetical protein